MATQMTTTMMKTSYYENDADHQHDNDNCHRYNDDDDDCDNEDADDDHEDTTWMAKMAIMLLLPMTIKATMMTKVLMKMPMMLVLMRCGDPIRNQRSAPQSRLVIFLTD